MSRSRRSPLPQPTRSKPRRNSNGLLKGLIIVGALALSGLYGLRHVVDPSASFGQTLGQMFHPIPAPQELFHKDRLAILLLGIDYNYDDKDQEYSAGARSDTIMALSLDLPSRSLHVLSIPRDMKYVYADGHIDKINGAYAAGGPHAAEKAIAQFLGIPGFDRYIVLRINATKALIDAIGGIDVPVTETLNYDDTWGHLHIHFKPGLTHMDGDQAVSYSRFRHDACSDPCRIKRQQQVMRITIAKLKSDKFNDLTHINSLIDVVDQNVQTDLSASEKLSLASAYAGFDVAALKTEQVPYVDDQTAPNGGDVLIPDDAEKTRLVQQLFIAAVPTPPPSDGTPAAKALASSAIHIKIENGSGVSGVGKHFADRFAHAGYRIESVGNASSFDHDVTEIHLAPSQAGLADRIRQELGDASAAIDTDLDENTAVPAQVRIVLGSDVVGAAVASPSTQ